MTLEDIIWYIEEKFTEFKLPRGWDFRVKVEKSFVSPGHYIAIYLVNEGKEHIFTTTGIYEDMQQLYYSTVELFRYPQTVQMMLDDQIKALEGTTVIRRDGEIYEVKTPAGADTGDVIRQAIDEFRWSTNETGLGTFVEKYVESNLASISEDLPIIVDSPLPTPTGETVMLPFPVGDVKETNVVIGASGAVKDVIGANGAMRETPASQTKIFIPLVGLIVLFLIVKQ